MSFISVLEWLHNMMYMVEKDKKVKDFFSEEKNDRFLGGHMVDLIEERNSWKSVHNRKQNHTCSLTCDFQACIKKAMENKVKFKDAEGDENDADTFWKLCKLKQVLFSKERLRHKGMYGHT